MDRPLINNFSYFKKFYQGLYIPKTIKVFFSDQTLVYLDLQITKRNKNIMIFYMIIKFLVAILFFTFDYFLCKKTIVKRKARRRISMWFFNTESCSYQLAWFLFNSILFSRQESWCYDLKKRLFDSVFCHNIWRFYENVTKTFWVFSLYCVQNICIRNWLKLVELTKFICKREEPLLYILQQLFKKICNIC